MKIKILIPIYNDWKSVLKLIENKFGKNAVQNIIEMSKVKLKRKIIEK